MSIPTHSQSIILWKVYGEYDAMLLIDNRRQQDKKVSSTQDRNISLPCWAI